jgi:hypothetical protein
MQLHHALHEREPEAKSTAAPIETAVGLRERLEEPVERLCVDAHPCVCNFEDGATFGLREGHRDLPILGSELRCVVQKVPEHLGKPRRVAVNPNRFARQFDGDLVFIEDRTVVVNRSPNQIDEVQSSPLEANLTANDASYIE